MLQNNVQECANVMKGSKPCVALMGEFSAGKTTLINFLLGEDVLPTQVTATHVPPVWISHGQGEPFYIDSDNHQNPIDLTDIQSLDVASVRYIKVFSEAEILKNMDLIDTPGISDPNIPEFHKDTAIENADAVIWCTHATQAWRESERSTWVALPEALRAGSILLATRSDKLDERSREKVRRRLVREAGELFGNIVMFSATDALLAVQDEDLADLLESSGGNLLKQTLEAVAQSMSSAPSTVESNVSAIRPMRVRRISDESRGRTAVPDAVEMGEQAEHEQAINDGSIAPLVLGADADTFHIVDDNEEHISADDAEVEFAADGHVDGAEGEYDPQHIDATEYPAEEIASDGPHADLSEPEEDFAETDDIYYDQIPQAMNEPLVDEVSAEVVEDDSDSLRSVEELLRANPPEASTRRSTKPNTPQTARALWKKTLAENNVESVADVLAAIEEFIGALDDHGMFTASSVNPSHNNSARRENSDWRKHG